ncbi:hypothetical protein TIFTF001_051875 [Ficus carica]|uniref:Uncharacterized protein n=1 Tax=Ficus carica TaxID=3494 RepID=A0AA88D561_FICCA|nr:hypothetical protein TIFTF001_046140 [Ficus carica]GMN27423.1 hypothetical protein TIFTF001_046141 [Ficus carica]GMN70170.1 hypothetical protein TIFTF001_039212 [Ficus carica]GMN71736.1 hypothetical protein TIFTF001_051875 [Ficus carica]
MSFNEQEGTCSCTLRRSSITQDIAREVSTTTAYSIGFVVVMKYDKRLYLLSESSLSYVYAVGKQPSAMVDTRWKGMAGQTVKCGKSSCYAFCSL